MDGPLQFIRPVNGKLEIVEETANKLKEINCPIIVIGVAGLYRTGKSYLLNRLYGQQKGFTVGPTVEACTRGLWIWGSTSNNNDYKQTFTILLDTEGLGDSKRVETSYDPTIFALSILLSSYFIYNSLGAINEPAIHQLEMVLNLTDYIKSEETMEERGENFDRQFPSFLWVLRDFSLRLEVNGESITEKQYLEQQLIFKTGYDVNTIRYNAIRKCITGYFRDRDCFTLPHPTTTEKMPNLQHMDIKELDPIFNTKMDNISKM